MQIDIFAGTNLQQNMHLLQIFYVKNVIKFSVLENFSTTTKPSTT